MRDLLAYENLDDDPPGSREEMTDDTNPTEDRTEPAPGYTVHKDPTLGWCYEGIRNGRVNGGRTLEDAVAETWEWHDFDRSREEATEPTRIAWRTLTEQTGYRVLTLPDGSTITSADIRRVLLRREVDETKSLGMIFPAHVSIAFASGGEHNVYKDVDSVLEVATEAHRRWCGRPGAHRASMAASGGGGGRKSAVVIEGGMSFAEPDPYPLIATECEMDECQRAKRGPGPGCDGVCLAMYPDYKGSAKR